MKNTSGSLLPYFKPLAFRAMFDILFNISSLTFPRVSFEVSKGLCNTGVSRENVVMHVGDESVLIIGVGHYSCYGGHISIGKPMLTREECYDSVFLENLWVKNGRSGESVGNGIMRAFD